MNVLAIETSGPAGSAAACRDEDVLAEEFTERGMEHGRMLVALVDRVVNDLEAVEQVGKPTLAVVAPQ